MSFWGTEGGLLLPEIGVLFEKEIGTFCGLFRTIWTVRSLLVRRSDVLTVTVSLACQEAEVSGSVSVTLTVTVHVGVGVGDGVSSRQGC